MWSTKSPRQNVRRENVVGTARTRRANNGNRRPRRLITEVLEQRQLLSVSPIPHNTAASSTPDMASRYADVAPVAVAPAAVDDAYAINGHQQLGANVLANDVYAEGSPLSVAIQDGPSHGVLRLDADGLFTYVPDRSFNGTDTFTYRFNDGQADSNVATVSISVTRVNDAPVAVNDSFHAEQNQPLAVPAETGLLANDHDANGDPLTASLVDGPQQGTLALQPDGSFTYTPNPGFHGIDTFSYKANDGQIDSNLATVTVEVGPVNSPPVAADDAFGVDQGQVLSVDGPGVLANDTDADGDALSAVLVTGPRNGTLMLGADGSFAYTPNAGFHGIDTFTYKANDGQADSMTASVSITVNKVNHAPTAVDDVYTTDAGQVLTVPANGVLGNDTDADGDALTAALVDAPTNGTLTLNADGSFQYTPNEGFSGADSFTYKANDGQADSSTASVTITVNPIENPDTKELKVQLVTSGSAFGPDSGPIWGGSTFWVSAYVEDLRDLPQGVVGGAIDLHFDDAHVTPTGNVAYGTQFTDFHQGTADTAAGMIDEAGALTTEAGVGANGLAPFMAWQFRRTGSGGPDDVNSAVSFAAEPAQGTATILPANFALVGLGTAVGWNNVEFDAANLNLDLGDFNGDGSVNQYDLALWIPHAGSVAGDGVYDAKFDLNADARVDSSDLSLLMARLYRPEFADAQVPVSGSLGSLVPGASDAGLQSPGRQNRVAAHASRDAAFGQLAASRWNAAEAHLPLDAAIFAHQQHKGNARHLSAALESVMDESDSWLSV